MHVRGASETVTNIDKINNIPVPNNNATIAKDNDSSFNTKNSESSVLNTSSTSIISNVIFC